MQLADDDENNGVHNTNITTTTTANSVRIDSDKSAENDSRNSSSSIAEVDDTTSRSLVNDGCTSALPTIKDAECSMKNLPKQSNNETRQIPNVPPPPSTDFPVTRPCTTPKPTTTTTPITVPTTTPSTTTTITMTTMRPTATTQKPTTTQKPATTTMKPIADKSPLLIENMSPLLGSYGDAAYPDKYSYHATLFFSDDKITGLFCLGAFVLYRTILTVAHCFYNNAYVLYKYVQISDGASNKNIKDISSAI
ncbi:salivary glue protein Sgs-3-like [Cephus cinctus]|uniref:Salivary glue protein Sgs-3-like n=1 Tax=Cephus cinctus TaxID=211228 RepID=A0AAJ7FP97_CEPCN|nr:salivary glue protein Sgs-3-like [Cephus cinctus]